jgi:hypothetical protein
LKKIFTLILSVFCFTAFSQTENDVREIVQLVVKSYQSESIVVYHKFDNRELLNTLFAIKSTQDYEQILPYLDSLSTDRVWEIVDEQESDTATTIIEKITIYHKMNYDTAKKYNNKKLNRFFRSDYQKRRKKKPLAIISTPIIATDSKKAFVYGLYVCGGFCGNGGIFFLEKTNNTWQIVRYDIRFIP